MKKLLYLFLSLSLSQSLAGQVVLRIESTPSIHLPNRWWNRYASTYTNPYQVYYKNGAFLRVIVQKYFYAGVGVQKEMIHAHTNKLRFQRASPRMLELVEKSIGDYRIDPSAREGTLLGYYQKTAIPLEIGYRFFRKKKPLGFDANVRFNVLSWRQGERSQYGDSLSYQVKYSIRDRLDLRHLSDIDWQITTGAFYKLNKQTSLSSGLVFGVNYGQPRSKFIGLNVGLNYALTR